VNAFAKIEAVAEVMAHFPQPWFVSGGWAIELFTGEVTRDHADLEIGICRRDQGLLYAYLAGWRLSKAVQGPEGGEWVPWEPDEWLALPIHQVLVQAAGVTPFEFECFLNEVEADTWHFRRDLSITLPVAELILYTDKGLPFIAPEIQLLYKAHRHEAKDEHDFDHALNRLSSPQRDWLQQMLQKCYPEDSWLPRLAA
jgi:hypothetical protein